MSESGNKPGALAGWASRRRPVADTGQVASRSDGPAADSARGPGSARLDSAGGGRQLAQALSLPRSKIEASPVSTVSSIRVRRAAIACSSPTTSSSACRAVRH